MFDLDGAADGYLIMAAPPQDLLEFSKSGARIGYRLVSSDAQTQGAVFKQQVAHTSKECTKALVSHARRRTGGFVL